MEIDKSGKTQQISKFTELTKTIETWWLIKFHMKNQLFAEEVKGRKVKRLMNETVSFDVLLLRY